MKVAFTIPLPVSANAMNRHTNKTIYNSKRYKEWNQAAGLVVNSQRIDPFEVPVNVRLRFGLRKKREGRPPDADNYVKSTMDLLQKCGVLREDNVNHVRSVSVTYDLDMAEEMIVVIEPCEAEVAA